MCEVLLKDEATVQVDKVWLVAWAPRIELSFYASTSRRWLVEQGSCSTGATYDVHICGRPETRQTVHASQRLAPRRLVDPRAFGVRKLLREAGKLGRISP